MNEEREFDAKKAKLTVKIVMPIFAVVVVVAFIVLPIKWYNSALRREADAENREVHKIIDVNLFKWLD